jgi:hypothetical protein
MPRIAVRQHRKVDLIIVGLLSLFFEPFELANVYRMK